MTQLLGHGLQRFRRHKGVGHAGRTGSDGNDALGTGGRLGSGSGNHGRDLMAIEAGTARGGFQHGGRILQGEIHAALIEALAVVGGEIHRAARHHQDEVGGGYFIGRGRLPGLDAGADIESELPARQFGLLFYPFSNEKAGGDARRAGRNQDCFHWASPEFSMEGD
ncbi:hypothetical protein D3C85_894540 [compost metagenome]